MMKIMHAHQISPRTRRFVALGFLFLLISSLLACSGDLETEGGQALRILDSSLDEAFINEDYVADIRVVDGQPPYTFSLDEGALPPGLSLTGGSIRGVPTELGQFDFTITVSDARLSKTFQVYTLSVVEAPPASLTLNVPETEVQRAVTLRAEVKDARDLRALRTAISWDSELFELLPDSVRANDEAVALFSDASEGRLQIDYAILGRTLSGSRRVFEFQLRPLLNLEEAPTLELNTQTEFLAADGRHAFEELSEGVPFFDESEEDLEADPDLDEQNQENNQDDGGTNNEGNQSQEDTGESP